jgi:hypothetical protein
MTASQPGQSAAARKVGLWYTEQRASKSRIGSGDAKSKENKAKLPKKKMQATDGVVHRDASEYA